MMLRLKDHGWDVITNSWTAMAKGRGGVVICYMWEGTGGFFIGDIAATRNVAVTMDMGGFVQYMTTQQNICDLREWCR